MAKYDLKNRYKVQLAREYFEKLIQKKAWIELREMRIPHSIDAHRLYFVWLNCIAKETNQDKDELHYLYRANFLRKPENDILQYLNRNIWDRARILIEDFKWFPGMNVIIDIISESTSLLAQDNYQFSLYLKKIQKHARVNHNIILLSKQDENFKDFYREYGFN